MRRGPSKRRAPGARRRRLRALGIALLRTEARLHGRCGGAGHEAGARAQGEGAARSARRLPGPGAAPRRRFQPDARRALHLAGAPPAGRARRDRGDLALPRARRRRGVHRAWLGRPRDRRRHVLPHARQAIRLLELERARLRLRAPRPQSPDASDLQGQPPPRRPARPPDRAAAGAGPARLTAQRCRRDSRASPSPPRARTAPANTSSGRTGSWSTSSPTATWSSPRRFRRRASGWSPR